ncbi:uncharacterized protein CELE_F14H12.6 [Caenorhabditis elegans]|uniref:Uncharacterized protein n=1 Tax=Caenorhabditis elegans TaxID=6239 RepID=Q966K4_CAEEL|nr:Uncharacterized protein CELE_F14H12.6 [Caenorhabditis elegans]CCD65404.1 Uncharacterized protein CELE_F14H12.6 [Caenorhabditis elegans]|eukprot:NP_508748.1 Uncharacterized protein CELE_F14H12.6 [Caenorhabditis elegans]
MRLLLLLCFMLSTVFARPSTFDPHPPAFNQLLNLLPPKTTIGPPVDSPVTDFLLSANIYVQISFVAAVVGVCCCFAVFARCQTRSEPKWYIEGVIERSRHSACNV